LLLLLLHLLLLLEGLLLLKLGLSLGHLLLLLLQRLDLVLPDKCLNLGTRHRQARSAANQVKDLWAKAGQVCG
jgi:hypothetical protein